LPRDGCKFEVDMRVLVVDDSDNIRLLISAMLKGAGYEVQTACNGIEAMEQLRQGDCRLVVSDWLMPEMNGIELCEAVRS
jgi:CheY-like chemotaxis protein